MYRFIALSNSYNRAFNEAKEASRILEELDEINCYCGGVQFSSFEVLRVT